MIDMKGKLYRIFDAKQVSDKFRKCDFVLEIEDGKYPQFVSFQITNDKIDQVSMLRLGDEVSVTFSIRGREWKSPSGEVKFFNTLDAYKVVPVKGAGGQGRTKNEPSDSFGGGADDPLPF